MMKAKPISFIMLILLICTATSCGQSSESESPNSVENEEIVVEETPSSDLLTTYATNDVNNNSNDSESDIKEPSPVTVVANSDPSDLANGQDTNDSSDNSQTVTNDDSDLLCKILSDNYLFTKGTNIIQNIEASKEFDFAHNDFTSLKATIRRASPIGTDVLVIFDNALGTNLLDIYAPCAEAFDDFGEFKEGYNIQISVIDLDNNGNDEILLSIGNGLDTMETAVFTIINDNIQLADTIWGQEYIAIQADNTIHIPYGSQGLFDVYTYNSNSSEIAYDTILPSSNAEDNINESAINSFWQKITGIWRYDAINDYYLFFGYDDDNTPISYSFILGSEIDATAFVTDVKVSGNLYTVSYYVPAYEGDEEGFIDPYDEYIYEHIYDISDIDNGTIRIIYDNVEHYYEEVYTFAANTLEELYSSPSDPNNEANSSLADNVVEKTDGTDPGRVAEISFLEELLNNPYVVLDYSKWLTHIWKLAFLYCEEGNYIQGYEYGVMYLDSAFSDVFGALGILDVIKDEVLRNSFKELALERFPIYEHILKDY